MRKGARLLVVSRPALLCSAQSAAHSAPPGWLAPPAVKALRAVHGRFYQDALPIGVGLIGPGLIGGTLLRQLQEQVGAGCRWVGRLPGL